MQLKILACCLLIAGWIGMFEVANATIYLTPETEPMRIIDYIKGGGEGIIETDLDVVEPVGPYEPDFKISNTLDDVREHLPAYLQWIAGMALVIAVILLIYNGIILMTSPLSGDQLAAVKKRMTYIVVGALAVTGFYFVLRILLSVILQLLNN